MTEPLSIEEKIDAFTKRIDNLEKKVDSLNNENRDLKLGVVGRFFIKNQGWNCYTFEIPPLINKKDTIVLINNCLKAFLI